MITGILKAEQKRIAQVKADAVNPQACSQEIPVAPARGPVAAFREGYWYEKNGRVEWRDLPYRSGCPGRTRDIFDTMTDQATRRGGGLPFTAGQVGTARDYRALDEKVQSAGMKCSKAFDVEIGSNGGADFMTAYRRDIERLGWFKRAIGRGDALSVRRHGAHTMDRGQRRSITDAVLIEMVCIRQHALNAVLEAHGWSLAAKNRKPLQSALCAILDRMQGI